MTHNPALSNIVVADAVALSQYPRHTDSLMWLLQGVRVVLSVQFYLSPSHSRSVSITLLCSNKYMRVSSRLWKRWLSVIIITSAAALTELNCWNSVETIGFQWGVVALLEWSVS